MPPSLESTRLSLGDELITDISYDIRMDVEEATMIYSDGHPSLNSTYVVTVDAEEPTIIYADDHHTPATDQPSMDVETSLYLDPVQLPVILDESSIIDRTELLDTTVAVTPDFTIIPSGTSRGKDMLVESPGYSYTMRKESPKTRFWWCGVRRQGNRCPASVSEREGVFNRGVHAHSHPADPGCLINKQLTRQTKDTAAGNVFQAAMVVVEDQLQDISPSAADNLPRPDHLVRKANRYRQNQRPDDPRTMDFPLATDHIPDGFLQFDLMVDGARHLVFATQHQLELLGQAKTWYLEGTFKVCRSTDVFDQLFGIHAFIKKDDAIKQVPLAFVFMSRRRKKDYKKVLKKIKTLLPLSPKVKAFVLDFEAAVWKAIKSVFPEASITGCAFHWTQAVWKRVQACGLSTAYNAGGGVQRIVRRLLALPLLPSEHIPTVFRVQKEKVTDNDQLAEVFRYVQDTWIDSSLWTPEDWSVYGQPVRTNNDCEGWHRRLNVRTHSRPPFYVLLQLLHKEASFVETQAKLVSSSKLTKNHRKTARQMQGKILLVWDRYSQGGMSADSLLKKLSKVYGQ